MNSVLNAVREEILSVQKTGPVIVAVDGVDGAGKTVFSHHLKTSIGERGKEVIVIAIDNFHNPRSIRYKQGKDSASGFYYDSYNYDSFITNVILPFQQQRQYASKVFDVDQDKVVLEKTSDVPQNCVLVVEGIFLNRQELAHFWDYSIYLDVSVETSLVRNIERSNAENDFERIREVERRFFARYRPGQELYISDANPTHKASIVIDNNDYLNPVIIAKKNLLPY